MRNVRILIALLMVFWIIGTPGLGVDTRANDDFALGAIYGAAFLLAVITFALTWLRPGLVAWLAIATGVVALVLAAIDLAGLTGPARPPVLLAVIELAIIAVAAAIAWSGWRLRAA